MLILCVDLNNAVTINNRLDKVETKIWDNFLKWIKTNDFMENKFMFQRGCLFQDHTTIMYMPLLEKLSEKEIVQLSSHVHKTIINSFAWLVRNDLQVILKYKYKISDKIAKDIADHVFVKIFSQAYVSMEFVR